MLLDQKNKLSTEEEKNQPALDLSTAAEVSGRINVDKLLSEKTKMYHMSRYYLLAMVKERCFLQCKDSDTILHIT